MDPGLLDTSLARLGIAVTAALVALLVAVWALIPLVQVRAEDRARGRAGA